MTNDPGRHRRLAVIGCTSGWHHDQLATAAAKRGVSMSAFGYEQLSAGDDIYIDQWPMKDFDAILTRTMPLASMEWMTLRLSMLHEANAKVPMINSPSSLELAIDKFRSIAIAQRLNFPVPPHRIAQDRSTAVQHFGELGGDVVVKPIFGGEGRGVMRIQHGEIARTVFSTLQTAGLVIYQQSFLPPGGRDQRLLIIGDQVIGLKRTNANDFRTNRSAGGQSTEMHPDDRLVEMSRRLMREMGLQIAAVDWIETDDGPVFLEINAVAGWKMAQSVCEHNIASQMLATVFS